MDVFLTWAVLKATKRDFFTDVLVGQRSQVFYNIVISRHHQVNLQWGEVYVLTVHVELVVSVLLEQSVISELIPHLHFFYLHALHAILEPEGMAKSNFVLAIWENQGAVWCVLNIGLVYFGVEQVCLDFVSTLELADEVKPALSISLVYVWVDYL